MSKYVNEDDKLIEGKLFRITPNFLSSTYKGYYRLQFNNSIYKDRDVESRGVWLDEAELKDMFNTFGEN